MQKVHHKDSNIPDDITSIEIRKAVEDYNNNVIKHRFRNSTTFDVIIDGNRYPPKAIIGLASCYITGKVLTPAHFSAGHGKKCFKLLQKNGFPIVLKSESIIYPDDVKETHYEGSVSKTTVNRYERDDKARAKCIEHYGLTCSVCGFNFEEVYGELGAGFIHIHHLTLLSSIGKEYKIDPIKDLRPVCPNCHSMLHKRRPKPYTISELKTIIKKKIWVIQKVKFMVLYLTSKNIGRLTVPNLYQKWLYFSKIIKKCMAKKP